MIIDLGIIRPGRTIRIPFNSFDKDDGSSITMTNFAAADILVYKDGSTTERASTSGYTATTDFDGKTGKHLMVIDLADNTTAGFWSAGSEYLVAIDAVTIDAVTVGGWVARFRIGYPGSWFDTTIATLTTQTSFTLTSGPAEDDALNDCRVLIHDVASGVQCAQGIVLDYTGATKTVTLSAGPTFTIAATDNISIMDAMPLQPVVAGRKVGVGASNQITLVDTTTNVTNGATTQDLVDAILEEPVTDHSGVAGSVAAAVVKLDATVSSRATPAQVNTEVVDALNVDTYAEPGQGNPAATTTLVAKINYLYKFLRNRITQDATTLKVYADDGTTVDQKATVSDNGTVYDRGEVGTGP